MKKFRKIMAVLVAAMMIMATMVPAWAATNVSGRLETDKGTITISNPKIGESYEVYRLFELASFKDDNNATGNHTVNGANGEFYSYVIRESSPWYKFLTENGPVGTTDLYAVSDKTPGASAEETAEDPTAAMQAAAYFTFSEEAITLNGSDDYHIIKATNNFQNAWDDVSADTDRSTEGESKGNDYVGTANAKTVQDFAQEALKFAQDVTNAVPKIVSMANPLTTTTAGYDAGKFKIMDGADETKNSNYLLGYYLVGSTMGTLASLDTTNPSVEMKEKNDEPKIEKKVAKKGTEAEDTPTWQENTDADFLDYVLFKTEITAEQGVKDYRLHDVMEPGLKFVNADTHKMIVTLETAAGDVYDITGEAGTIDSAAVEGHGTQTDIENYELLSGASATGGCTFNILFKDVNLTANSAVVDDDQVSFVGKKDNKYHFVDIKDGDKIVVKYWAQLLNTAVVFDGVDTTAAVNTTVKDNSNGTIGSQVSNTSNQNKRNDNYTMLTYGAHSYLAWDAATVTTYQFDITKTKDDAFNKELLEGAKFKVYKLEKDASGAYSHDGETYKIDSTIGGALFFTAGSNGEYKYDGDEASGSGAEITSLSAYPLSLKGLEAGVYMVEETYAPTGFDKLAHPLFVTINGRSDDASRTASGLTADMVAETNEGKIRTSFTKNNGDTYTTAAANYESHAASTSTNASTSRVEYTDGGLRVINTTGQELPSTGGMGTTVLYIVGGMLVILAGAYLFFSRKRTA